MAFLNDAWLKLGVVVATIAFMIMQQTLKDLGSTRPGDFLPSESNHVVGVPRVIFYGRFQSYVATLNNDVRDYITANNPNITENDVRFSNYYQWSQFGSNSFRFNDCPITNAVAPDSTSSPANADPLLLQSSIGGPPGRIVDLDVQYQQVAQLWGLHVKIGELFEADYVPAGMLLTEFASEQSVNHKQPGMGIEGPPHYYGVAFQSSLINVKFGDHCLDAHIAKQNPTLCALRSVAEQRGNKLAIRITVDAYVTNATAPNFSTGLVQGVIGPYAEGEPTVVSRAHQLYCSLYDASVMHVSVLRSSDHRLRWVVDMATTIQYQITGQRELAPSMQDLVLQVDVQNITGSVSCTNGVNVRTLASIPLSLMAQEDFRRVNASLFEFWTNSTLEYVTYAKSRLRIVPRQRQCDSWSSFSNQDPENERNWTLAKWPRTSTYYALEAPSGEYAVVEKMYGRMYERDNITLDVYVTKFGVQVDSPTGVTVQPLFADQGYYALFKSPKYFPFPTQNFTVTKLSTLTTNQYKQQYVLTAPSILISCADMHLNMIVKQTDNDGFDDYNLAIPALNNCPVCQDPTYTGLVPARCFMGLDSNAFVLQVGTNGMPPEATQNRGALLVWHKEANPPITPTWLHDILPLFRPFARMFPVMNTFINLSDYTSVTNMRSIAGLKRAFNADISDANYMPVTRDLSPAKMAMIKRWLQFPAYDTPPVPVDDSDVTSWTLPKLLERLHTLLLVEHATVPTYLSALYSIKTGALPKTRKLLTSIVHEEMQHMMLVSNIILALNGTPNMAHPDNVPQFPTELPFGLVPNHTFSLFPLSHDSIDTFLAIERSNQYTTDCSTVEQTKTCTLRVPQPGSKDADTQTISGVYLSVRQGLIFLENEANKRNETIFTGRITTQMSQIAVDAHVVLVTDLSSALAAIDVITTEGEGESIAEPVGQEHLLAHFFRFLEVKYQAPVMSVKRNGDGRVGNEPSTFTVTFEGTPVHNFPFHEYVHQPKPCGTPQPTTCTLMSSCESLDTRVSEFYLASLEATEEMVTGHTVNMGKAVGAMRDLQIALNVMIDPLGHLMQKGDDPADFNCSFQPSFLLPSKSKSNIPSWPRYFVTNWTMFLTTSEKRPPYEGTEADGLAAGIPLPYSASTGYSYYDDSDGGRLMLEVYDTNCLNIFSTWAGTGPQFPCKFWNGVDPTGAHAAYMLSPQGQVPDEPHRHTCCLFARPNYGPQRDFLEQADAKFFGVSNLNGANIRMWKTGAPPAGPFSYSFYANNTPGEFGFASSNEHDWIVQRYHNFKIEQPPLETWAFPNECLNAPDCHDQGGPPPTTTTKTTSTSPSDAGAAVGVEEAARSNSAVCDEGRTPEEHARNVAELKQFAQRWNTLFEQAEFETIAHTMCTEDVAVGSAPASTSPSGLIFGWENYVAGMVGAYKGNSGDEHNILTMKYEGWEYIAVDEHLYYTIGLYSLENGTGSSVSGVNCWLLKRAGLTQAFLIYRVINN